MMTELRLAATLAGIFLALCTLPGTVELLALTVAGLLPGRRARRQLEIPRRDPIRIAIIVPAHDEEASIGACVRNLLECDRGKDEVEVFVVADNCSDRTAVQAENAGARCLVRTDPDRRGKGYALDFAFRALMDSGFDLFIVIDADTTAPENLVREFSAEFGNGAEAMQCRYGVRNTGDSRRTRWMNIALMAFNVLRPRGRDRLGLSAGLFGNGFALTRATIQQIPYAAFSVVEDLEYHIRLMRAGWRVHFVDTVTVLGEMPVSGKAVLTQRSRWEGGRFRMLVDLAPQLAKAVCAGEWRCIEPLLDLMLLPLAFHVTMLALAICTPVLIVRWYAAGALTVVLAHLLAAISVGGGGWPDVVALLSAPFYVLWKLRVIPDLVKGARHGSAWVRTARVATKGVPR